MQVVDDIKGFLKEFIKLLNAHLKYYRVVALEHFIKLLAKLVALVIFLLTGLIFWLFLSVWLSFVIGDAVESIGLGFLIMGVINIVVGYVFYLLRVVLIIDPIISWFSEVFTQKEEENNGH